MEPTATRCGSIEAVPRDARTALWEHERQLFQRKIDSSGCSCPRHSAGYHQRATSPVSWAAEIEEHERSLLSAGGECPAIYRVAQSPLLLLFSAAKLAPTSLLGQAPTGLLDAAPEREAPAALVTAALIATDSRAADLVASARDDSHVDALQGAESYGPDGWPTSSEEVDMTLQALLADIESALDDDGSCSPDHGILVDGRRCWGAAEFDGWPMSNEKEEDLDALQALLADSGSALDDSGSRSPDHDMDGRRCWGASLKALLDAPQPSCAADFRPGKSHLKNKFCARCRDDGFFIPASHVFSLTPELERFFVNRSTNGLWSRIKTGASSAEVVFRVVNQTKKSRGNALIICRTPPPDMAWAELPNESLCPSFAFDNKKVMQIRVAKGTLVPVDSRPIEVNGGDKRRAAECELIAEPAKRAMLAVPTPTALPAFSSTLGGWMATGHHTLTTICTVPMTTGRHAPSPTTASASSSTPPAFNDADATPQPSAATFSGADAAALTSDSSRAVPPSPPMSPPDSMPSDMGVVTPIGARSAVVLPTAVAIHPITLRFSCAITEAEWRDAHARSVLSIAMFMVPIQPAVYLALAFGEANQGSRIWLIAWGLGYAPAAILMLALYAAHGRTSGDTHLPLWVPRWLDWATCSLCIMPQLLLLVLTWRGVADPIDPLDSMNGAEHFGKCLANTFLAHMHLRLNSTAHGPSLVAYAVSIALMAYSPPISTVPAAEIALYRKGVLSGLVGGYVLERELRRDYLRNLGEKAGLPTGHSKAASQVAGATRMNPLTRRFSCAALETQYRAWLFTSSYPLIECLTAILTAVHLCSYLEGHATLVAATVRFLLWSAPPLVRCSMHRRGDQAKDVRPFGVFYLVYDLCFLFVSYCTPSLAGDGVDGDISLGAWLFSQPLLLVLQGGETRYNLLLSAIALGLSCACPSLCPSWLWRTSHPEADAAALRDAIIAGDIFAYVVDYAIRSRYLKLHGGAAPMIGTTKEIPVEQP